MASLLPAIGCAFSLGYILGTKEGRSQAISFPPGLFAPQNPAIPPDFSKVKNSFVGGEWRTEGELNQALKDEQSALEAKAARLT